MNNSLISVDELNEQNEMLADINDGIEAFHKAFSKLAPGTILVDEQDNIVTSDTYNYSPGEKESIQFMINQYNELIKSQSLVVDMMSVLLSENNKGSE